MQNSGFCPKLEEVKNEGLKHLQKSCKCSWLLGILQTWSSWQSSSTGVEHLHLPESSLELWVLRDCWKWSCESLSLCLYFPIFRGIVLKRSIRRETRETQESGKVVFVQIRSHKYEYPYIINPYIISLYDKWGTEHGQFNHLLASLCLNKDFQGTSQGSW